MPQKIPESDSDEAIPNVSGPATVAAYRSLFPHRNVLLHTFVTGSSNVLVVCPQKYGPVAKALEDIIRHHSIGFGGSLLTIHHEPLTIPTAATIREKLGPGHGILALDVLLVFGYESTQIGIPDTKIKLWIDGLADLVRSEYSWEPGQRFLPKIERNRGVLLVQVASLAHECWQHTAKRYHDLVHGMGLRLDAVNSLHYSNQFDIAMTISRHKALARNLANIPNGDHERLVGYLRTHTKTLKMSVAGLEKSLIENGDTMLGLFIPDGSASGEQNWWDLSEPARQKNQKRERGRRNNMDKSSY
ncbi:uncharacterized protein SETTUDRAFT_35542 [Exserohilum turcica Et28A]|uniref:Uncharacterized protein n=1 Tax=Exserohilum turcicum (strain 28A) TaxID=671987 RepID=R0JW55_EXST2|nr:uncharacterized protein SETTUDRAFT_35542 [Exserohilum turcica Et28A]EOA81719.1 hypothetical protein SETTUDRAFT_35542 [Exserohilum turcica Et28A]